MCFVCPYTGDRHCDGPCGMCPEGECVGDESEREEESEQC